MNGESIPQAVKALSQLGMNNVRKRRIDLLALRYMGQQLCLTLQTLEQPLTDELPFLYTTSERRCCTHRIVLYDPQQLALNRPLAFVGFVSGRRADTHADVDQQLHAVDVRMLTELTRIPGLLSYSSLELRPGRWYNLVLLQGLDAKQHFKQIQTHQYAAYQLAPRAYDWIRIHSGIIPNGLSGGAMDVLKTKHYVYQREDESVSMCEVIY
ncbi:MAG: hypothetical protein NVS2B12_25070 [Ktedonobacteraceae bacterium]